MRWNTVTDFIAGVSFPPLLSDVLLKATVLLLAVALAALVLRRSSAATRHLAWSLGLAGLLILPLLSLAIPVRLRVLPASLSASATPSESGPPRFSERRAPRAESQETTPAGPQETYEVASDAETAAIASEAVGVGPMAVLAVIWALGAAFVLARYIFGMVVIGRVVRKSRRLDDEWEAIIERAIRQLGVTAAFDIRRSDAVAMPFAYGVFTPTIVLPAASYEWSAERREAVILHELAHVNRGDLIMNMLSNVACAAYWFHPLVWMAAHRLRVEGERASDDTVLTTGARPSDYAEHLLHIVHSVRDAVPAGALAMARRSDFEGRLLAILEPSVRRGRLSRLRTAAVAGAFFLGVVPLSAMSPAPAPAPVGDAVAGSEWVEPELEAEPFTQSSSPSTSSATPSTETANSSRVAQAQPSSALAALIQILADENASVRLAAVKSLGELGDPRAIAALGKALREDADARVRETAAWALGEIDDVRAVPQLVEALKTERTANVRERIVWALGEIDDPAAVSAIVAVTKDANAGVRRQAAWALGEIDDASAVGALVAMARDTDVEVRRNVASALGELEDAAAIEPLTLLARDSDAEVRQHAVSALGDIEDERTLPALLLALKDTDAEVRTHAASAIGNIHDLRTAPRALIDALADPDREVKKHVIEALAEISDVAAVPALKRLVADQDTEIRRSTVEALAEIGGPEALEALMAMLKDPDPEIRRIVAESLGSRRR